LYNVICTDAAGCVSVSSPIQVIEPNTLEVNVSILEEDCARNNGSILLAAQGGTPAYSYQWGHDNTLLTASATGLNTGIYSFTTTDTNGCSVSENNLFLALDCPCDWIANAVIVHPNCGAVNGTIDLSIGGGLPNGTYTYLWSNGATTASLDNLTEQVLCVTITDASGLCTKTYCYALESVEGPVISSLSVNGAICNGTQGSITFNVNSTNAPYQIMWGASSQLNVPNGAYTISNLSAGTYQVTITSNNGTGCKTILDNVVVPSLPGTLLMTQITSVNAVCGLSNGSLSPIFTGGTAPYTCTLIGLYGATMSTQITNNAVAPLFTGLSAGSYTIRIVDAIGCAISSNAIVTTGGIDINVGDFSLSMITCPGGGGAINSVINPIPGVQYTVYPSYNGTPMGIPATDLIPGIYTIVATNTSGCADAVAIEITSPNPWIVDFYITPATCLDGGIVNVVSRGATAPYTYSWSGGQTGSTVTGLIPGIYEVTITDANGCSVEKQINVGKICPCALAINEVVIFNALCSNNNGSIRLTTAGGNGPITFNWSPLVSTTHIANNLLAGIYSVIATDSTGCTATTSGSMVVSNVGGPQFANLVITPATCNAIDGAIRFNISGGRAPYLVTSSAGNVLLATPTSVEITGLPFGFHTIVITDADGCLWGENIEVTRSSGNLQFSSAIVNATCGNNANGSITVTTNLGLFPFTYSLNGVLNTPSNNNIFSNLRAGTYVVGVIDANGCMADSTVTINEGTFTLTNADFSVTNSTCPGSADGTFTPVNAGITFNVFNSFGSPVAVGNWGALDPGLYTVRGLESGTGCIAFDTFTVHTPPRWYVIFSVTDKTCAGNDGSIVVETTGATPPYSYLWSNGLTTSTITGLASGTFLITITDANGCVVIDSAFVADACLCNDFMISDIRYLKPTCGNNDGTIHVNVMGGQPAYTAQWNLSPSTGLTLTGVGPNVYSVTVTDMNGCVDQGTVAVENIAGPTITVNTTTPATCTQSTGTATLNIVGGTAPYTVTSPVGTVSGTSIFNLPSGNVNVRVQDANGCVGYIDVLIQNGPGVFNISTIPLQPNCGLNDGTIEVTPLNGTLPYNIAITSLDNNFSNTINNATGTTNLTGLASNVYLITVSESTGCVFRDTITLDNVGIPPLTINNFVIENVTCPGSENGSVVLAANSLYDPISIYVVDLASGRQLGHLPQFNLPPGDYAFVQYLGACVTRLPFKVFDKPEWEVGIGAANPPCMAGQAYIDVTVSGATAPYTYLWNYNAATTQDLINIFPGNYRLTITDGLGCVFIDSITVRPCHSDTTVYVPTGTTDTICVELNDIAFNGTLVSVTTTSCGSVTNAQSYSINGANCLVYTALPVTQGVDTICVVVCDNMGFCDTTTVYIVVIYPDCAGFGFVDEIHGQVFDAACSGTDEICFPIPFSTNSNFQVTIDRVIYTGARNSCNQGNGISVNVPVGSHVVTFTDQFGCADSSRVIIACTPTQFIVDTTLITTTEDTCFTSNVTVATGNATVIEICDGQDTTGVEFTYTTVGNQVCITYTGNQLGRDTACFVICGDFGICDTIRYVVTVYELPPIANPDTLTVIQTTPNGNIDVCPNDLGGPYREIDSMRILDQPLFGTATVQNGCDIAYQYNNTTDCSEDGNPVDSFRYVVWNTGGADTTWVYVIVTCDDFDIFNGFSPNDDGFNEHFHITGITRYPQSELEIYNRWGNLVYNKIGYQNDWLGTWGENPLPDGTYFYILRLNNGSGREYADYLEIRR
jgi:gliding motility-associated-like protein